MQSPEGSVRAASALLSFSKGSCFELFNLMNSVLTFAFLLGFNFYIIRLMD